MRISDCMSYVCSSDLSPMDDEGFRHYLENDYSGSLSAKAVGDVISRCRRIEAAFNVDLSQGSDIEHLVKRLGEIVDDPNSWSVLRNALYRYRDYKIGRASGRERVCQYVSIRVGAGYLK